MHRSISIVLLTAALAFATLHLPAQAASVNPSTSTKSATNQISLRSQPKKPEAGSRFRLRGRIHSSQSRQRLKIQLWTGSKWRKVASTRSNKRGRFSVRLRAPRQQSKTWYRAVGKKPRIRSRTLRVRLLAPTPTAPAITEPDPDSSTQPEISNSSPTPTQPTPVTPLRPRTLAGSDRTNCALDTSGTAWCWGSFSGTVQLTPAAVTAQQPFISVAASTDAACGLTSLGAVQCWQDAPGGSAASLVPGSHRFRFITGGSGNRSGFCGLDEVGSVWCWGEAPAIIHGEGDQPWQEPRQVAAELGSLVDVSLTQGHICVVDVASQAWCWGANHVGQLGSGDAFLGTSAATPVRVTGEQRFTQVLVAPRHSCALTATQQAWCWGANEFGQLGNPAVRDYGCWSETGENRWFCSHSPLSISSEITFHDLAPGQNHTCATSATPVHALYCWGDDDDGQLGTGTSGLPAFALTEVPDSPGGSAVASGRSHSCALATDATVWCWGTGDVGQLGLASLVNDPLPAQPVSGSTHFLIAPSN
jgi:hypothetical protein